MIDDPENKIGRVLVELILVNNLIKHTISLNSIKYNNSPNVVTKDKKGLYQDTCIFVHLNILKLPT